MSARSPASWSATSVMTSGGESMAILAAIRDVVIIVAGVLWILGAL